MTAPKVLVVDYGMGNLRSMARALERAGAKVTVGGDADTVRTADRVVVPGQGAFGQAMTRLADTGLADALKDRVAAARPTFGVCLGLQILFESSEEAPGTAGLGLLDGAVTLLPAGGDLKRPHMGWSPVDHDSTHPVLAANRSGAAFYFVHSYAAHGATGAADADVATAEHGVRFVAAAAQGSLVATQFHPEKSQEAGHRLLTAWLTL